MSDEKHIPCQRCGGEPDPDIRHLRMACFYDLSELGLPFEKVDGLFVLAVCKDCRGDWMQAVKAWFETRPIRESPGTGIFVRRNGTAVEVSEEEWREIQARRPGTAPEGET